MEFIAIVVVVIVVFLLVRIWGTLGDIEHALSHIRNIFEQNQIQGIRNDVSMISTFNECRSSAKEAGGNKMNWTFLRKLAREAVIFALLGMVVTVIVTFVVFENENRTSSREFARSVAQENYNKTARPDAFDWGTRVPLRLNDGTILSVDKCEPGPSNCNLWSIQAEKDYWAAYQEHRELGASFAGALFLSLFGFPGGLAVWIFYRTVRFAVKG